MLDSLLYVVDNVKILYDYKYSNPGHMLETTFTKMMAQNLEKYTEIVD